MSINPTGPTPPPTPRDDFRREGDLELPPHAVLPDGLSEIKAEKETLRPEVRFPTLMAIFNAMHKEKKEG